MVADLVARAGRAGQVSADRSSTRDCVLELGRARARDPARSRRRRSAGSPTWLASASRSVAAIRAAVARMERAI